MSFTAVATDLESGDEVWLREGKLFDAIRASIATPLVFTPFLHGTRTLLDGALVNPLPIGPTLGDATDLTVAVNVSAAAELRPAPAASTATVDSDSYRQRIRTFIDSLHIARSPAAPSRGLFDVAITAMQTMQDTITRLKLAAYSPDVIVDIPRNACGFFEFWRAEELIALGRERAAQGFAKSGR
jgi:NTE family protein